MFFRRKRSGGNEYLQIVKSERVGGKPRQVVVATLGRLDELEESGGLDRLLRSGARFSDHALLLSAFEKGEATTISAKRIGPPMVFERLWAETGCRQVVEALLADRGFEFPVERAVFLTVLHRLVDPGSDRAAEKWRQAYRIEGMAGLELHHLYRAMAWLGEELEDQEAAGLVPRTTKDLIEERLFGSRRDLFTDLDLVMLDTTSIYFEGAGGERLGRYGHSKDHRPDLKQMIVGVVIDDAGRPICSELLPGNTSDVTTLLPVIARLRARFAIGRVCVVADRGMISAATMAELEARDIDYILGVRERSLPDIAAILEDPAPYVPLSLPKAAGRGTTDLEIKEVIREALNEDGTWRQKRYIVCYNQAEAEKDTTTREAVLESLERKLRQGDKALLANKGYQRYLKTSGPEHFIIDPDRVAADARFDGIYVLRTNSRLSAIEVALAYRQRWMIEDIFRTAKSLLETRPIFHKRDETIRGHVFCSFLALILRKELMDRLAAAGRDLEWRDLVRDLDCLIETEIAQHGKHFLIRPQAPGCAGAVFQATGVALPPLIRQPGQPPPPPRRRKQKLPRPRRRSAKADSHAPNTLL